AQAAGQPLELVLDRLPRLAAQGGDGGAHLARAAARGQLRDLLADDPLDLAHDRRDVSVPGVRGVGEQRRDPLEVDHADVVVGLDVRIDVERQGQVDDEGGSRRLARVPVLQGGGHDLGVDDGATGAGDGDDEARTGELAGQRL